MANLTNMTNNTDSGDTIGWDHPNIPYAIIISIGAGLATGIGGSMVLCPGLLAKFPQQAILAAALALSAGVMIYVSFIEIFFKCLEKIEGTKGVTEGAAVGITTLIFFAGMGFCALLEVLVGCMSKGGHDHGPATTTTSAETGDVKPKIQDGSLIGNPDEAPSLQRMGIMTALAIGLHNFPEGLATFLATVEDTALGASLGVAIAIHNIPEGLCVAMPIYYATGSKCKAFGWSLLSGVTEPIGGIVGFAALQPVMTDMVFGIIFGMVGGMMVFIVCHELLPAAHKYMGSGAWATAWFVLGMMIMALSLVLFVI